MKAPRHGHHRLSIPGAGGVHLAADVAPAALGALVLREQHLRRAADHVTHQLLGAALRREILRHEAQGVRPDLWPAAQRAARQQRIGGDARRAVRDGLAYLVRVSRIVPRGGGGLADQPLQVIQGLHAAPLSSNEENHRRSDAISRISLRDADATAQPPYDSAEARGVSRAERLYAGEGLDDLTRFRICLPPRTGRGFRLTLARSPGHAATNQLRGGRVVHGSPAATGEAVPSQGGVE